MKCTYNFVHVFAALFRADTLTFKLGFNLWA